MSVRRTRALRRALLPPLAAGVLVATSALPALAHVRVSSPDAAPGGFGKLVFRVPTESDTASTTKLTVTLPRDAPFAFVSSRPVPGWSVATRERRLSKPLKAEGFTLSKVVSSITWTAGAGEGIKPGEFDEFELSVGPFPKSASSIAIPTTQTYSDGTVVKWDQSSPEGKPEPEHPAPVLDLASASGSAGGSSAAQDVTVRTSSSPAAAGTDDLGRWLGGAGLVVAVVALVVSLARGRRGSRPA